MLLKEIDRKQAGKICSVMQRSWQKTDIEVDKEQILKCTIWQETDIEIHNVTQRNWQETGIKVHNLTQRSWQETDIEMYNAPSDTKKLTRDILK